MGTSTPTPIQIKRADYKNAFLGLHSLRDGEPVFTRNVDIANGPQRGQTIPDNNLYIGGNDEVGGFASFTNSQDLLFLQKYISLNLQKIAMKEQIEQFFPTVRFAYDGYIYNRGIISGGNLSFDATNRLIKCKPGTCFMNGTMYSFSELSASVPIISSTNPESKRYIILYKNPSTEEFSLKISGTFSRYHTWQELPAFLAPYTDLVLSDDPDINDQVTKYNANYYPSEILILGSFIQSASDTGSSINSTTVNSLDDLREENKGVYGRYEPEFPFSFSSYPSLVAVSPYLPNATMDVSKSAHSKIKSLYIVNSFLGPKDAMGDIWTTTTISDSNFDVDILSSNKKYTIVTNSILDFINITVAELSQ